MHSVSAIVCEGGGREGRRSDQFPVGMSVLAVDDDPTCLRVLEALLLRCRYHVTTTDQATVALQLLRENRNKFDLVISDVHMPDMDGFKLLELVGLEMDLPVIMLSVNGETKTVMKGITHGACDYLLKPVRIEELKNIWQHVVRRRKLGCKDYSHFDMVESETHQSFSSAGGQSLHFHGLSDHNGKLTRKRKEQNEEDEEDDSEGNMHESEDSAAQKKSRVVWSIDLHRKFVAAVNQLGIEKAVPKRILDLMNDDKLTRENVASHLQKYRLYLKRLSAVASQQASIVAAFGARDPSYIHMSSLDGFGTFSALTASGQLPAFPLQPSEMIVKPNTNDLGVHGLTSSRVVQFGQNNTSIPTNDINRLQKFIFSSNQNEKLQGIPTSLELEQLQLKGFQEANGHFPGGFASSGLSTSSPRSTQLQHMHSKGLVNHSSVRSMPIPLEPFIVGARIPSNLPDLAKYKDIRQCSAPLAGYTTNTLSIGSLSNNDDIPKLTDNFPLPLRDRNHRCIHSISTVASSSEDPFIGREGQSQSSSPSRTTVIMPTSMGGETNFLNFTNAGNCNHGLDFCKDHIVERNVLSNSFPSSSLPTNFVISPVSGNERMTNSHCNRRIAEGVISFQNANSILPLNYKNGKLTTEGLQKDKCNLEAMKLQGGRVLTSCGLNDLLSSFIKPENDHICFMDSDTGSDLYPLGACM